MPEKRTVPPALSLKALGDLRNIEKLAQALLLGCIGIPYNVHKATEILQGCMIQAFDIRVRYYLSLPTRHPTWVEQIAEQSLEAAIGMLPIDAQYQSSVRATLKRTLEDHIEGPPHLTARFSEPFEQPTPPDTPTPVTPKAKTLSEQLDDLTILRNLSHEDQAAEIGLSRAAYFKVKAGGGGKKSRRKVEIYLSTTSDQKKD